MALTTDEQRARRLLRSFGLGSVKPYEQYVESLRQRFGPAAGRYLGVAKRRALGEAIDLYPFKNASLDLSLAISSQELQPFQEQYLGHVLRICRHAPASILDLGCESGVLTCALAKQWPNARVVGVEINKQAARVARELIARHRLKNVEITVGSISEESTLRSLSTNQFDLVSASCVFHEVLKTSSGTDDDPERFSIADTPDWKPANANSLATVRQVMGPTSVMVTSNRWQSAAWAYRWVRLTEVMNFEMDMTLSQMIVCGDERLPITVHRPAQDCSQRMRAEDILALYSERHFRSSPDCFDFTASEAEAMYLSLDAKRTIGSFTAAYHNGSGTLRQELLVSGALSALYKSTSKGYRQLLLRTLKSLPELVDLMAFDREWMSLHAEVQDSELNIDPSLRRYGIENPNS
jgi:SAM-dependent methyltransferase